MKYIKIIIMSVLLIPNIIYAKNITIDEFDLTININDEWDIFTRDNLINNDLLTKYNVEMNEVLNNMKENSIYIDAIMDDYELFLRGNNEADINNLTNYKDSDINLFAEGLMKKTGANNYELLKSNGITYVKSKYIDSNLGAYLVEYVTIFNRNNITFTIQNYNGFPTSEEEKELDEMIKTTTIKLNSLYKKENNSTNFYTNIIYTAIIGAVVGGLIGFMNTKKKNSKQTTSVSESEKIDKSL